MRPGVLAVVMSFVGPVVLAQGIPNQLQQEILAYKLTLPKSHSLITATREMTVHIMGQPDFQARFLRLMQMSPADQRAEMEKDAKAMAILNTHNLTTQ